MPTPKGFFLPVGGGLAGPTLLGGGEIGALDAEEAAGAAEGTSATWGSEEAGAAGAEGTSAVARLSEAIEAARPVPGAGEEGRVSSTALPATMARTPTPRAILAERPRPVGVGASPPIPSWVDWLEERAVRALDTSPAGDRAGTTETRSTAGREGNMDTPRPSPARSALAGMPPATARIRATISVDRASAKGTRSSAYSRAEDGRRAGSLERPWWIRSASSWGRSGRTDRIGSGSAVKSLKSRSFGDSAW
jgi:hypothetical protein